MFNDPFSVRIFCPARAPSVVSIFRLSVAMAADFSEVPAHRLLIFGYTRVGPAAQLLLLPDDRVGFDLQQHLRLNQFGYFDHACCRTDASENFAMRPPDVLPILSDARYKD